MEIILFTEEPNQEAREGRDTYSFDKTDTIFTEETDHETREGRYTYSFNEIDIDAFIKDKNKFCLLDKLQISSSMIYKTSQLEDCKISDKDDDCKRKTQDLMLAHPNKENWELPQPQLIVAEKDRNKGDITNK